MLGIGNALCHDGLVPKFDPTFISDLEFWFRSNQGIITASGTNTVDTWVDNTNTYYAKAADAGDDRPTWTSSGIVFDGTQQSLELFEPNGTTQNPHTLDTSGGWTFGAIYTDGNWDAAAAAIVGDADSNYHFIRHNSGANSFSVKASNQIRTLNLDEALTDGTFYLIMVTCSTAGALKLYVNNVQQDHTTAVEFSDNTKDLEIEAIGEKNNTNLLGGTVKHVFAYNKELSSAERSDIKNWADYFLSDD